MERRVLIPLVAYLFLSGCASAPVQPAYQVALPSCGMDAVRVCDNFGHARSERSCACVRDTMLSFE